MKKCGVFIVNLFFFIWYEEKKINRLYFKLG